MNAENHQRCKILEKTKDCFGYVERKNTGEKREIPDAKRVGGTRLTGLVITKR